MSSSASNPRLTDEQIVAGYKELKAQQSSIMTKLTEIETDLSEYSLVVRAIENLEPQRKCFRMVGDVLVERTVGEVLPAVVQNRDGIKDLIKKLEEQLQTKTKEVNDYMVHYNIKIQQQQ
eukprot:gene7699-9470_t